jgi:hypothetical protein
LVTLRTTQSPQLPQNHTFAPIVRRSEPIVYLEDSQRIHQADETMTALHQSIERQMSYAKLDVSVSRLKFDERSAKIKYDQIGLRHRNPLSP